MSSQRLCGAVLLSLCLHGSPLLADAAPEQSPLARLVLYPSAEAETDPRQNYPLSLLRLALHKSGLPFTLQAHPSQMMQRRVVYNLRQRNGLDVFWSMSTDGRESGLRPVRFPIYQGLLGVRLPLVRADRLGELGAVAELHQLKALRGVQGHDWPDYEIQRAAGLQVFAASGYNQLFAMLAGRRVDYVLRSVVEIWAELDGRTELPLAVLPGIGVCYPTVAYFFVNPEDDELARALATGLARAQADGSFRQLFDQHFGPLLARAEPASRRWLVLPNPLLTEASRGDAQACESRWLSHLADAGSGE